MHQHARIAPAPAARSNAAPPVYAPSRPALHRVPQNQPPSRSNAAPPAYSKSSYPPMLDAAPHVHLPSRLWNTAPALAKRLSPSMYEYIRYQDERNWKGDESRAHYTRAVSKILYLHDFSTILERILLHLQDIRSILQCMRVSRVFKSTIFRSEHLQRALWMRAMPSNIELKIPIHFLTPPSVVDPLITYLRTTLDLFIRFQPSKQQYNVLCCPASERHIGIALSGRLLYQLKSWKSMLVVRGAEADMRWVVAYQASGMYWEANLGFRPTAPTFSEVMNCVTHMERLNNGQRC